MSAARPSDASVLVVADHPNTEKIARHYGPLAAVAAETTMVCMHGSDQVDGIDFLEVPAGGHRLIGIPLMFVFGLVEAVRGDYDVVVAISLVPYGCFALVIGRLRSLPVHLGIIGADIDRHAVAWYGAIPRALFRRFDSISVPGSTHVRRLVRAGVDPDRVFVLTNPIDVARFQPRGQGTARPIDLLWIGRFSEEKDPLRFVDILNELASRGLDVDAAMVGAGPLDDAVRRALARTGLAERVVVTGWLDDPIEFYRRSRVFVLTSRREGLPLTLVEAMAMGVVPVVPAVGSVTDAARDGHNAVVVPDRRPTTYADAIAPLCADEAARRRLAENAEGVRQEYSLASARSDWRRILSAVLGG